MKRTATLPLCGKRDSLAAALRPRHRRPPTPPEWGLRGRHVAVAAAPGHTRTRASAVVCTPRCGQTRTANTCDHSGPQTSFLALKPRARRHPSPQADAGRPPIFTLPRFCPPRHVADPEPHTVSPLGSVSAFGNVRSGSPGVFSRLDSASLLSAEQHSAGCVDHGGSAQPPPGGRLGCSRTFCFPSYFNIFLLL